MKNENYEPLARRFIPVQVAFAEIGVGRTRGYELINQGLIAARKLGRKTYVDRLSIERMFEALPELKPVSRIGRVITAAELGLPDEDAPRERPALDPYLAALTLPAGALDGPSADSGEPAHESAIATGSSMAPASANASAARAGQ